MPAAPPAPDFETLYHRAFSDYRVHALWNVRGLEHPSPAEALAITQDLRVEGNLEARRLAEQIEQACRAIWDSGNAVCQTGPENFDVPKARTAAYSAP